MDASTNRAAAAATAIQPVPKGRGPDIADLVCADIMARKAEGVKKYGEPLRSFNGRSALVDAYQEVIDLAKYLRQELEERGAAGTESNTIDNLRRHLELQIEDRKSLIEAAGELEEWQSNANAILETLSEIATGSKDWATWSELEYAVRGLVLKLSPKQGSPEACRIALADLIRAIDPAQWANHPDVEAYKLTPSLREAIAKAWGALLDPLPQPKENDDARS